MNIYRVFRYHPETGRNEFVRKAKAETSWPARREVAKELNVSPFDLFAIRIREDQKA